MKEGEDMEGQMYTRQQVAKILNVTEVTVSRLIKSGKLEAFKIGEQIRITNASFQKFLEDSKIEV